MPTAVKTLRVEECSDNRILSAVSVILGAVHYTGNILGCGRCMRTVVQSASLSPTPEPDTFIHRLWYLLLQGD